MKVFVAGASGAIGRPLVRQLVADGHEVTGMTRSAERADAIRATGAQTVVCDVFDAAKLESAVREAAPEAVVHLLTALPPRLDYRDKDALAPTNRVRTEGTRNLLAAACAACARRLIVESVAFFYAPQGDLVKDEEAPLFPDAPPPFGSAVAALKDLERQVLEAEGIEGIVLRYGWLYGPGTYYASDGSLTEDAHRRRLPVVGKGAGVFSFVHVEDAASATVAALERGGPGVYNVVDDDPGPGCEWTPAFTAAVGAKKPFRVPVWLARLVAGPAAATMATQLRGASNAKAKRELDWQPRYPSWRQGFADPEARG
ncbi:MAG TPA: NAD(P)-dependent oxidoreductase [Solirubrobacterales bacterium]|nr:NAD(P)-dependent oxidoreductase [Solirubrobacterales bacterium]